MGALDMAHYMTKLSEDEKNLYKSLNVSQLTEAQQEEARQRKEKERQEFMELEAKRTGGSMSLSDVKAWCRLAMMFGDEAQKEIARASYAAEQAERDKNLLF